MSRHARLIVPLSVPPTVPFHEPDLASDHKEAIVQALRWAWSELSQRDPQTLRTGDEESISERLENVLNERQDGVRRVRWLRDFETVVRGANQRTADDRIQKKPDLTFRPLSAYKSVTNTTRWGLFVECKIVNGGHSVSAYRDKGVARFSTGEYAAWMPSGAMLAYVRDRSAPASALQKALPGHVGTKSLHPSPTADRIDSEHDRSKLAKPCVDVVLIHLWLEAP